MSTTLLSRTAVLAALLAGAPLLARSAQAQRSGSIHASALVTQSLLGARLRPDAGAATQPAANPTVRRLRLPRVGVVDVLTGPGEEIRVARQSAKDGKDEAGDAGEVLLAAYVGS